MQKLFKLLLQHKGMIVSSASLSVSNIKQAQASDRMFVDKDGLGYVWMPDITTFPDTEEKVEQFEKWFPLDEELPQKLKNWNLFEDKREIFGC